MEVTQKTQSFNFFKRLLVEARELLENRLGFILTTITLTQVAYFLSGYIFWFNRNCLDFEWTGAITFLPSYFARGFPLLLVATLAAIPLSLIKVKISSRQMLLLVFAFAFMNSLSAWRVPEYNPDAILWHYQAKYLAEKSVTKFLSDWGKAFPVSTGLPLPSLIFGVCYSLFGEHRLVIQAANALFFSASTILIFKLAREWFKDEVAAYAALLFGCSPFIVFQTGLMLTDVITMFFLILCIYLAVLTANRAQLRYPILLSVSIYLSLLTKYSAAVFLIPILGLTFILSVHRRISGRSALRKSLVLLIPLTLLLVATVSFKLETFLGQFRYFTAGGTRILLESPLLDPELGFLPFHWGFITTIAKGIVVSVTIPIVIVSLHALLTHVRQPRSSNIKLIVILSVWILIPTLFLFTPRITYLGARHVMATFPAYCILAAISLAKLKDVRLRGLVLVTLMVFSITTTQLVYVETWSQDVSVNLMEASRFIESNVKDNQTVLVVYPYMAYWFDIYSDKGVVGRPPNTTPFILPANASLFEYLSQLGYPPEFLIIVSGESDIGNMILNSTPKISPPEATFLNTYYVHAETFNQGQLHGPWQKLIVDIYILSTQVKQPYPWQLERPQIA